MEGEFIASGSCEVNFQRGEVTMWPSREAHMLERQRGALVLDLEDGRRLNISDRHLTFKLSGPDRQRISVYRLRLLDRIPEHLAAGYADEADADETKEMPVERPSLHIVAPNAEPGE